MSIRLLITLIALLTVNNVAIAQLPPVQWESSYGGTLDDEAFDMKLTSDGGSIVVGQTNSNDSDVSGNHGNYDYWVIKLSSTGALQWQRCLGGTGNQQAYSVQQTTDGGYVIAGTSRDTANGDITDSTWGYDYWIVKLDDTGAIQWQKSYGSTGDDIPSSIIQTTDGGYMVAGIADSANGDVTLIKGMHDIWLIKLDDTGALQWQKTYGGSGDDYPTSIIQTTDAGYIFTGYTNSNDGDVSGNHGSNDVWVVKISATGGMQWQKCYGGTQSDGAASIIRTADSNYVFAGFSYSTDGDVTKNQGHSDVWMAKISPSGSLIWQSSFGGLSYEQAQSVQQTVDGGFIAGGWSFSNDGDVFGNNGNGDYWAAKVSATGALQVAALPRRLRQRPVLLHPANARPGLPACRLQQLAERRRDRKFRRR